MEVRWLERSLADVSAEDNWLGPWERSHLETLRFPKRRDDWRLGRWTAKNAVAWALGLPRSPAGLAGIEIRPEASGAPEVFLDNRPANLAISISHRGGTAACAIAPNGAMLGCDLEIVEPRSDAFVADYFTADEQAAVRQVAAEDRSALIALIWSAKESALKALRAGLRIDTRRLSVVLDDTDIAVLARLQPGVFHGRAAVQTSPQLWHSLHVEYLSQHVFQGWWFCRAGLLRTEVSLPAAQDPPLVETSSSRSQTLAPLS